jgi:cell division septation protein DedD
MNLERFIGFIFLVSAILMVGLLIEPQDQYKKKELIVLDNQPEKENEEVIQENENVESLAKPKIVSETKAEEQPSSKLIDQTYNQDFLEESDYDLYVLRVHVLSSEEKAQNLSKKIKEGGYPSFVEVFGDNKNRYAIFVGPFLSKEEITSNMEDIKKVSQSNQGEVLRWKL